jgi:hypothetical protein
VKIIDMRKEFEEGQDIGRIIMTLESDWNKPITGYANITTNSQTFKSPTIELMEPTELEVFIENPGDIIQIRLLFDTFDETQEFTFSDIGKEFDLELFLVTLVLIFFLIRSVVRID